MGMRRVLLLASLLSMVACPVGKISAQVGTCLTQPSTDVALPLPDDATSDMGKLRQYVIDNLNQGVAVESLAEIVAPGYPQAVSGIVGNFDSDGIEDMAEVMTLSSSPTTTLFPTAKNRPSCSPPPSFY